MLTKLIVVTTILSFCSISYAENFLDRKQYQAEKAKVTKWGKKGKKINRKISQVDRLDYVAVFEDDTKNLISEIIGGDIYLKRKKIGTTKGATSNGRLYNIINKYNRDSEYDKLSPQAKWVAAQIAALKPMRGIVARLKPLVEDADAPMIHSLVVTGIRGVNAGINAFNFDSKWDVGFDFLTKPFTSLDKEKDLISNETDLYNFVKDEVLPNLRILSGRLRALIYAGKTPIEFEPFYFDNKLLYKSMNVVHENDRFVLIDRAEVHAALSATYYAISSLEYSLGYSWTGLLKTMNNVAKAYGLYNNKLTANPDKMTAKERIERIRKEKNLFRLNKNGKEYTEAAWAYFREASRQARLSWIYIDGYEGTSGERYPLLDPRAIAPFARVIDTSFDNIEELIDIEDSEDHMTVRSSMIQGETIKVKTKALFFDPPTSLRDFLPTSFHGGQKETEFKVVGGKIKARNYQYGNPKGWNTKVYNKYFPDINTDEDIPRAARILSQTWGTSVMGMALYPMLF